MADLECKHYNARVRSSDRWGTVYCEDCKEIIPVSVLMNSILNLRRQLMDVLGSKLQQL